MNNFSMTAINQVLQTGFTGLLGVVVTELNNNGLVAKAPISNASYQPAGIVHGGVYLALAETMAGLGSMMLVDRNNYDVLGMQVSANHTGSAKSGEMKIVANCMHQGKKTHIWSVDIFSQDKLLSSARVTNMIVKKA